MPTLDELIRASGLPLLEAQVLAGHALGLSRTAVVIDGGRDLESEDARRIERLFLRRAKGEPVAYITSEREFRGLSFRVTPDVLIPRSETELLVDLAIERAPSGGRVLELGTGSGAVAVSIAHALPDAEVWATDISAPALAVAQENARRHGAGIRFLGSDWFVALPGERFDLVVSNPPYVAEDDPHLGQGDLRYEPRAALAGGADGLDAIRAIAAGARTHLLPGGWLLLEHGYDQADRARSLLAIYGFMAVRSWRDLADIERVTGGCVP